MLRKNLGDAGDNAPYLASIALADEVNMVL